VGWVSEGQAFVFTLLNPSNEPQVRRIITNIGNAVHLGTSQGATAVYGYGYDLKYFFQ